MPLIDKALFHYVHILHMGFHTLGGWKPHKFHWGQAPFLHLVWKRCQSLNYITLRCWRSENDLVGCPNCLAKTNLPQVIIKVVEDKARHRRHHALRLEYIHPKGQKPRNSPLAVINWLKKCFLSERSYPNIPFSKNQIVIKNLFTVASGEIMWPQSYLVIYRHLPWLNSNSLSLEQIIIASIKGDSSIPCST